MDRKTIKFYYVSPRAVKRIVALLILVLMYAIFMFIFNQIINPTVIVSSIYAIGIFFLVFVVLISILNGKRIRFNSANIEVKYFLPFRKTVSVNYADIVGYILWRQDGQGVMVNLGKSQGIDIELKNERCVRISDFYRNKNISPKKITLAAACLETHGIKKLNEISSMPSLSKDPYL